MIDNTKPTGFKTVPINMTKLSQELVKDDRICKLLYYSDEKCLRSPTLTSDQKKELFEKDYIQIMPRILVDENNIVKNYIHLSADYFIKNENNPEYMNCIFIVSIACYSDKSNMKIIDKNGEVSIRSYELAHWVNKKIDGQKFTGIGTANLLKAENYVLATNPEYCGITLEYEMIESNS